MYEYYFTFRSVTAASRAVRAMERAGISNRMLRTPKQLQQKGCGYSVSVKKSSLAQAQSILKQEGIEARSLFQRIGQHDWQEVAP